MKRIILTSTIWITLLLSIQELKTQNVFPTGEAIWNILINGKEHYYGLTGDTIINDTIYNKLYLLNDTTLVIDENDTYCGGFRQEGKKFGLERLITILIHGIMINLKLKPYYMIFL